MSTTQNLQKLYEFPQFGNLDKTKCFAASTTDEKAFREKIFSTSAQKLTDLLFLRLTATFRAGLGHPSDTGERGFFILRECTGHTNHPMEGMVFCKVHSVVTVALCRFSSSCIGRFKCPVIHYFCLSPCVGYFLFKSSE